MPVLKTISKGLAFVCLNAFYSGRVGALPRIKEDGVIYRACNRSDISNVMGLFKTLNNGGEASLFQRLVYYIACRRFIYIAERETSEGFEISAFLICYFTKRDIVERTIHVNFIGARYGRKNTKAVLRLLRLANEHYCSSGLVGCSARITETNKASLAIAAKSGYRSIERYCDPVSKKYRHYMLYMYEKSAGEAK